jgi:hypothetical protein
MTCSPFQIYRPFAIALLVLFALPATPWSQDKELSPHELSQQAALEEKKTDAPIVIELFTASDCTACVLADRMIYDAAKDKQVIALSCHIKDINGSLDSSSPKYNPDGGTGPMDPCIFRQWSYENRRTQSDVSINIPTFVFNGENKLGVDSMPAFLNTLRSYHFSGRNKALEVLMQWKDKDTLTINLPQHPNSAKERISGSVWLIRYKDMEVQKIESGQNAGRVLRFSNIIQDSRHIGKWYGGMRSIEVDVTAPKGGKDRGGYVVVVQEMMGEPMQAAGKLEDYPMPNDLKKSAEPQAAPTTAPKRINP